MRTPLCATKLLSSAALVVPITFACGCAPGGLPISDERVAEEGEMPLGPGSITATTDANALANALLGTTEAITITSATYAGATPASGTYQDGPLGLTRGALFTTGGALLSLPPNDNGNTSKNNSRSGSPLCNSLIDGASSYDATKLQMTFDLAAGYDGISLLSVFGSEEYPEYVGSDYNDVYGVYLNGKQIAFDGTGAPITINGPFFSGSQVVVPPATGTEYDGSTDVLVTKGPLAGGSTGNVLEVVICDAGDRIYDSGVFIAGLTGCVGDDCSGTEPCSTVDADGDGADACDDCDDTNASVLPGGVEACDGLDNDCDGDADDDCGGGACTPGDGLQSGAPWPTAQRCLSRRGTTPVVVSPSLAVKWQFALNGWGASPVIGADGTIYAPGQHLYALAPSGVQKWVFPIGQDLWSPTITKDGTIVVGAKNSTVYAVRPDGTQRWKFQLDSSLTVSPVVSATGTIFVHSAKKVYALDANGAELWSAAPGISTFFAMALDDAGQTLYLGDNNQVVAMSLNGAVKWIHNEGVGSELVVGPEGNVYFTGQGMGYPVVALAPNGTKLWSVSTITGGRVRAVDETSTVYTVSTAVGHDGLVATQNGAGKWYFKPNNTQGGFNGLNVPVIDGAGRVLITSGPKVFALDAATGAVTWETQLSVGNGAGTFMAIGADGSLYLRGEKLIAVGSN
jgi:hypothetical protein